MIAGRTATPQPALATTRQRMATVDVEDFYRGEIAAGMDADMQSKQKGGA